jgi:hypothetical protein
MYLEYEMVTQQDKKQVKNNPVSTDIPFIQANSKHSIRSIFFINLLDATFASIILT